MASLVGANRAQGGDIARFTIPAPPGVNICAYPSLARLIDDRLLCVYSAYDPRCDGKADANTWSAPEVLIDSVDGDSDLLAVGGEDSIDRTRTDLVQQSSNALVSRATSARIAGPQWSYGYSSAGNKNSAVSATIDTSNYQC